MRSHIPTPSPWIHPSKIIREVGFKCSECGNKYITYESSDSEITPIPCPTCDCDVFGERLEYEEGLRLDIEVNEKRKKGEKVKNIRSLEDWKRYRGTPPDKRRKNARVKPELDKRLK